MRFGEGHADGAPVLTLSLPWGGCPQPQLALGVLRAALDPGSGHPPCAPQGPQVALAWMLNPACFP